MPDVTRVPCPLADGLSCVYAAELACLDAVESRTDGACDVCSSHPQAPRGLNHITISLALHGLRNDPDRFKAMLLQYGHLLRRVQPLPPNSPPTCRARGAVERTIPGDWLNCGCTGATLVECSVFDGLAVVAPLSEESLEVVSNNVPRFRGVSCFGCTSIIP